MTRILLAEDDAAIALVLRDDLRLEGYEVEHVSNGDDALARIEAGTFDLVLLDVMMPGRDGFKVCEEARRRGHQVPILFVTARSLEAERILGFRLGADDYIVKPFSSLELRARVDAVLRRTKGARGAQVHRFADCTLDIERWELRRGDAVVPCSSTELKVLAALVQAKGRVLTRRQIIDNVWGTQTFITERVVDNHVLALRKKIEVDQERPQLLVSVRGIGYRFDARP
jgi:DNA-binding response OmpR family regulator